MIPPRPHRRAQRWLIGALAIIALAVAAPALARVGGGHSFSSGSRSSSSGGGGGDGSGELLYFLFRLCIEVPEIGIPLMLCFVGWIAWQTYHSSGEVSFHEAPPPPVAHDRGWHALLQIDPAFSRPVLDDLLQLVYRRAWEAASRRDFAPLAPWLSDGAQQALAAQLGGVQADEIVVASIQVEHVSVGAQRTSLIVRYCGSRREAGRNRRYTEQVWTFTRPSDVRSPSPVDVQRMGCPSCGAAVQCDDLGRCRNCSTPIGQGQRSWQATEVRTEVSRPVDAPQLSVWTAEEPGYRVPTVYAPDYAAQMRAFSGRHPAFSVDQFKARAAHAFTALQTSWGQGRWDDARPFTTDMSWNTLRFWIDTYAAAGLLNRTANLQIEQMEVVKITMDAWYEAITVRIRASMCDWVEERATHKVVSGNADRPRKFSEYWTFVRAVGSGDASKDPARCPSCGAPLDKINAAGVCGYCESVITTGQFDWVLSRIDQPEVYRG